MFLLMKTESTRNVYMFYSINYDVYILIWCFRDSKMELNVQITKTQQYSECQKVVCFL